MIFIPDGLILSKQTSTVNSPIGYKLPFTVTLSISLQIFLVFLLQASYRMFVSSRGTPYYFVAASNLAAIFTFGDK
jgi:hypothetical protein